ncbi:MAG: hypothetical protein ACP5NC_08185 [Nitrososphaeria archaeon]
MRIRPLSTDTIINLEKWSRKLRLNTVTNSEESNTVIVLGDGTPDDIAVLLLATKLDGAKTAYLVKPQESTYWAYQLATSAVTVEACQTVPCNV